jgi:hypothetical protein
MTNCFRNALFSVSRSSFWSATFGRRNLHLLEERAVRRRAAEQRNWKPGTSGQSELRRVI